MSDIQTKSIRFSAVGAGEARPGLDSPASKAVQLNIVNQIFKHRLQQSDVDRLLHALSSDEREEFVSKIGDLLKRISALLDVYNKLADVLSLDLLLKRLVEIITEALNSDRSTLYLYDAETKELFARVTVGEESTKEIRFPCHVGIAGNVFTSGEGLIIPDAYSETRFNQEVDRRTGYRTRNILCTPMRNRKREIIGVSQVLNKLEGDFTSDDMAMLEAITSQAASALENAKLHEKVERARREEEQMLEVTNAISRELHLDALLAKIMSVTTQILDADRSTLFLHDPKNKQLWSRVAGGVGVKEIRIPEGAGIAGSVFMSGITANIPDAYLDRRFNQEVDRRTGYHTRNILCMPVTNKAGHSVGVTQVLNKRGGPFTLDDEKRLRAFGAQAAIALENAQLFEDVMNARNYNESILRSLSNGVITLNADKVIIKVNESALTTLRAKAEELTYKSAFDVFGGRNSWILDRLQVVEAKGTTDLTMDTDLVLADGSTSSVNLSVVPLIDVKNLPIGFMLILDDISEEKRVKTTMSRYMNKDVIEKVLQKGNDALQGTLQEVTILFSDIRSFTTLSERVGAKGTVSILNEYFTEMVDVLFHYGASPDKFIGDAIMANFGSPFGKPEDADNAVSVACEMIVRLRAYNDRREAEGLEPIDIGVGVNTGEVVAGNIGSKKRMEYTVIGDGVNLASRLEGVTKTYGAKVIISEFTHRRLKQPRKFRQLDLIKVKGKELPVAIYELLDCHSERTFPNMDQVVVAYERGLQSYRSRQFQPAIEAFEQALHLHPDDKASKIFIERSAHYLQHPPHESWDGSWTMKEK